MDLGILLACAGAGISLFGFVQYVNGILYHGTQPRIASWAAWFTANTVFSIVAFQEHAWLAVGINALAATTNLTAIIVSAVKKVPMKPADTIDWSCLFASIMCIGVMVAVPDMGQLVAVLAMVANITATVPTFRHAWSKPHEETWQFFAANVFANGLGVASIVIATGAELATLAGPLIATIGNLALVTMTVARKWVVAVEQEVVEDIRLAEQRLMPVEQEAEL